MKRLAFLAMTLPGGAMAAGFDRPSPNAQSATAELWFGLASLALLLALWAVHRMVSRR